MRKFAMNKDKESPIHFEGKSAMEHVIDARLKGLEASREIHGMEVPGHYSAAADAAKETAFLLGILVILSRGGEIFWLGALIIGWVIWKAGRSAALGWTRLERLHRLIEEERWEIEHHREQEREELKAMYATKGFEGKMLEEITDVLMADDNRLLQVMLEEELGLRLESYEHPLKQACGAALGVIGAAALMLTGRWALGEAGVLISGAFMIAFSAAMSAKLEKNRLLTAIVWNLAIGALAAGIAYFSAQLVI
jgi:hypothetical protein